MTTGSIDQDKIIAHVFSEIAKSTLKAAGEVLSAPIQKLIDAYKKDFRPYLGNTLTRCSYIKTLLHRDEPIPLSSIYVSTNLKCVEKNYDDISFIDALPKLKTAVVVGSAGSGKSMFTKYLFTALFEKSSGRIPIYIELRQMNSFQAKDLIAFIYHSLVTPGGVVTREQFESGLKSGLFSFILDGFDEVDFDWRENLEAQIFSLREKYPNNIIIVTSRPDERYTAWTSFSVFNIQPMTKTHVVALIKKLNYDTEIKLKFIKTIESGLYQKHRSFLSNPLLAIMMLITFDQFAHIPDKIHIFYEYAFDALFFRHDASKHGGYKRKLRTEMPIDDFKNCLSSFCVSTYAKEKLQFTESEFRDFLKKALEFEKKEVDVDKFMIDLLEAVCVFQRDGLYLTFAHRSFQEYFSAFFISRSPSVSIRNLLNQISRRALTDTVLLMAHEMNKALIEREWLLPWLNEIIKATESIDIRKNIIGYVLVFWKKISMNLDDYRVVVTEATELGYARMGIMRIYQTTYDAIREKHGEARPHSKAAIKKIVDEIRRGGDARFKAKTKKKNRESADTEVPLLPSDSKWLRRTWIYEFVKEEKSLLKSLTSEIETSLSTKEKIVETLFS